MLTVARTVSVPAEAAVEFDRAVHGLDGGALLLQRYGHLYKGARRQAAIAVESHVAGATEDSAVGVGVGLEGGELMTPLAKSLQIGDGAYRDRTDDLQLAKLALSQLS